MQTTTAVSADVPAQTQHIAKGSSLWIEEATRLHDADDHYCFRGHASNNTEVYGLGRRGSTMQTTTAVSADVPAQTQHITKGTSLWIEELTRLHDADTITVAAGMPARIQNSMDRSDATPRCRQPLPFPLTCQHRCNISRRVQVYGSRKQRGSMTQTTTTVSAGMPARIQKSMDRGSDAAPQYSLVGRQLPFLAKHDDLADRCVVLAARCPPDVNFHHEAVKRRHFFLRESMHLLPLVTVLVLDTVTVR